MYAQQISSSRFVELCLGMVVSETSSYFTHTSYFLNTVITTFLFTPLDIHTRHHHELRDTSVCWVLFQYTDTRCRIQCVFHDGESRTSTCYFLTPSRKEEVKHSYFCGCPKCIKFYCLNKRCSGSMPLLLQSHCPMQVQISGLGTWTRHSNAQTSETTI
jgi:hypothetical protein